MQQHVFEIEHTDRAITVTPHESEVTATHMKELVDQLIEKIEQDKARNFIFDMHNVEFVDSACLGRLISLLQAVKNVNGQIALVRCQPNVEFLLRMTHLDNLFGVYDSLEEAAKSL